MSKKRTTFVKAVAICFALIGAGALGFATTPASARFGCGEGTGNCYSVPGGCGVGVGCVRLMCQDPECPHSDQSNDECYYCESQQ